MSLDFEKALKVSRGTHLPTINYVAKQLGVVRAEAALALLCYEAGPLSAPVLAALTGHSSDDLATEDGFLTKAVGKGLIEPVRNLPNGARYYRLCPSLEPTIKTLVKDANKLYRQALQSRQSGFNSEGEAIEEVQSALGSVALEKDRLPFANNMGVMRQITQSSNLSPYEAHKLVHLIEDGGLLGSTRTDLLRRPYAGYHYGAMQKLVEAGFVHRCTFRGEKDSFYYPSQHLRRLYERTLSPAIDDYLSSVRRLTVSAGRTKASVQKGSDFVRTLKTYLTTPPVSDAEQRLGLRASTAGAHVRQMASITGLMPSQIALILAAAEVGDISSEAASELSGFERVKHRHGDLLSATAVGDQAPWLIHLKPKTGPRVYRFNEARSSDLARLVVQADARIRAFRAHRLEAAQRMAHKHPLAPTL